MCSFITCKCKCYCKPTDTHCIQTNIPQKVASLLYVNRLCKSNQTINLNLYEFSKQQSNIQTKGENGIVS